MIDLVAWFGAHGLEFVAALEHAAILDGHHVLALLVPELGVLLNHVERPLGGALVDREQRPVLEEIDGVIAPLASGDFASIQIEDAVELAPVEGNSVCGGEGVGSL